MVEISSTRRTQIIKSDPSWIHKNTATDFSELAGWNISNVRWYIDNILMLEVTPNAVGELQLSSWYWFARYSIDNRTWWARCEVANAVAADISSESDWDYYLYLLLNSTILASWSADPDGADASALVLSDVEPTTGFFLPLYKINKLGNDISIVEDYREQRKVSFGELDVDIINIFLKDLQDVDNNLSPINDSILAYNSTTMQFESKSLADVANIKKMVVDVVLGEDVVAWDWYWAVFYGVWNLDTLLTEQLIWWTDVSMGNGVQLKIRDMHLVPWNGNYANLLKSRLMNIKKVGTPTDAVAINIYESDGTTLIVALDPILGTNLSTAYQENEVVSELVDLTTYEWQNIYIEFSRTGGQDPANYFDFEWTAGAGVEYFNGTIRSSDWTILYSKIQWQYFFEKNKVWKHNWAYRSTNICNWIVVDSGAVEETVQMVSAWFLDQTVTEPWERYFAGWAAQNNIVDDWPYTSDWDTYQEVVSYTFDKTAAIENMTFDLIWYSVWNQAQAQIKINGGIVGTATVSWTGWRIPTWIPLSTSVGSGDVLSIELRVFLWTAGMTAGIRNIIIEKKDQAEPGTFWTKYAITWYAPFLIGIGGEDSFITLLINEQKAILESLNYVKGVAWIIDSNNAWGAATVTERTFIMPAKWIFEYYASAFTTNSWWSPLPSASIAIQINGVTVYAISLWNNSLSIQDRRMIPVNAGDEIRIYTQAYKWRAYSRYQFYNY